MRTKTEEGNQKVVAIEAEGNKYSSMYRDKRREIWLFMGKGA